MPFCQERNALVATHHKDRCTTSLRVVDPFDDPHVWVIIDEGCNSCTHSDAWRINTQEKLANIGFKAYLKDKKITNFSGVGSAPSTGKWVFPCRFQLTESQMILPGHVASHEIANSKHPLLFSQAAQAQLGFTKSSRSGAITLDDYQGQNLEVVRQAKTGLFMVRIDHMLRDYYLKDTFLKRLCVDDVNLRWTHQPSWKPDEDQEEESSSPRWAEACGYVATPKD